MASPQLDVKQVHAPIVPVASARHSFDCRGEETIAVGHENAGQQRQMVSFDAEAVNSHRPVLSEHGFCAVAKDWAKHLMK